MTEEGLRVLELLERGRISAEQAMALLESVGGGAPGRGGGRRLRIRVYEGGAAPAANISVPLAWAKYMAPFIEDHIKTRLAEKGYALDTDSLQEAVARAEPARLVEVQDGAEKVEIFIE